VARSPQREETSQGQKYAFLNFNSEHVSGATRGRKLIKLKQEGMSAYLDWNKIIILLNQLASRDQKKVD